MKIIIILLTNKTDYVINIIQKQIMIQYIKKEKKILIKKIPFEEEIIPLLLNAHICNGIHNNLNKMKKIFLIGEFY